jgi:hypothetical protein
MFVDAVKPWQKDGYVTIAVSNAPDATGPCLQIQKITVVDAILNAKNMVLF